MARVVHGIARVNRCDNQGSCLRRRRPLPVSVHSPSSCRASVELRAHLLRAARAGRDGWGPRRLERHLSGDRGGYLSRSAGASRLAVRAGAAQPFSLFPAFLREFHARAACGAGVSDRMRRRRRDPDWRDLWADRKAGRAFMNATRRNRREPNEEILVYRRDISMNCAPRAKASPICGSAWHTLNSSQKAGKHACRGHARNWTNNGRP